jgi:hypothetical protein
LRAGNSAAKAGESFVPKRRAVMEALLPILIFIVVFGAINFYEFGRID